MCLYEFNFFRKISHKMGFLYSTLKVYCSNSTHYKNKWISLAIYWQLLHLPQSSIPTLIRLPTCCTCSLLMVMDSYLHVTCYLCQIQWNIVCKWQHFPWAEIFLRARVQCPRREAEMMFATHQPRNYCPGTQKLAAPRRNITQP